VAKTTSLALASVATLIEAKLSNTPAYCLPLTT
jgi:hypothetical protein